MLEVADYIQSNLRVDANCIKVPCLAKTFGVCERKLYQVFKAQYGIPVHQYVIAKRMELGKEMLAHPGARVMDISIELGYTSLENFSRDFKQYSGYSPRGYRKMLEASA